MGLKARRTERTNTHTAPKFNKKTTQCTRRLHQYNCTLCLCLRSHLYVKLVMGQSSFPDADKLVGKINFLNWVGLFMVAAERKLCAEFFDADPANHPVEPAAGTVAHDRWAERKAEARWILLNSVALELRSKSIFPSFPCI